MTDTLTSLPFLVDAELRSVARPLSADADAQIGVLSRRLVSGEERAWDEFHDLYGGRLMRYLLVVCRGDEQAAREALQAALVRIVKHVRRFDREEAFWGWLAVVARSCVVDGARRQNRYRALLERYAGFFGVSAAVPVEEDPLPGLLSETLGRLEADDQVLLAAKYHEGQRTVDLAAERGCSEKAIESRLARLRQRLRSEILQRLSHEN